MWRKLAVIAVSPVMVVLSAPVHADPADYVDPRANYAVFLKLIKLDGVEINDNQAIQEAYGVCELMRGPEAYSLWDAGQHVLTVHPDWKVGDALDFATRSVQNICPHNGGF